eukprot:CAMPEP_0115267290 /NCGR_PEP_ID=MMETSP0270-20121206/51913_1 /TAXON_ID=71861 /ORGANISM="Scrippsiella trochoidea, Strain CCMP3099" /LENGTH=276 /DNA_ID=CAMNT_0002683425 /DNA_START=15 /DNA_END=843 /DNA_ORIENTATION=+
MPAHHYSSGLAPATDAATVLQREASTNPLLCSGPFLLHSLRASVAVKLTCGVCERRAKRGCEMVAPQARARQTRSRCTLARRGQILLDPSRNEQGRLSGLLCANGNTEPESRYAVCTVHPQGTVGVSALGMRHDIAHDWDHLGVVPEGLQAIEHHSGWRRDFGHDVPPPCSTLTLLPLHLEPVPEPLVVCCQDRRQFWPSALLDNGSVHCGLAPPLAIHLATAEAMDAAGHCQSHEPYDRQCPHRICRRSKRSQAAPIQLPHRAHRRSIGSAMLDM